MLKSYFSKALVAACLLSGSLALNGGLLKGQNTAAQENKRDKLRKEIALLDKQLKENASKSRSALSELGMIKTKISHRNELISESEKEIKNLSARIKEKQKEINAMQARLDTLASYYSKLVLNAYKNRDTKIWYMYILASENIGQAFRRIGYLKSLSGQMNIQARKIKKLKAEIEMVKERLLVLKSEAETLKAQRIKEMEALKKEEKSSEDIIKKLKKDKNKYQKELDSKKKQVETLNREIERIIREATRAASNSKGGSKPKQEIDYVLDKDFSNNKGKLPWPAEGPVVEKFGQHYHPVFHRVKLPFNNGISMAVSPGAPVKAVFDGVVKQIVVMPGYNKCVLVQHGSYFSFYCKLDRTSVKAGDKIKTGDEIGSVGTIDGVSQLHFQIWKGTSPQNPETWLR